MDRIRIVGIVCEARLGVSRPERTRSQKVSVDLCLQLDMDAAANTDDLRLTVDYHEMAETIRRAVAESPCRLLEALASRICGAALAHPRIESVTVKVRKWPSAMREQVDFVEVEMTRGRR